MHVFCGTTPFLRIENFYKLFDSLGMIYPESKQLEDWYQRVLGNSLPNEKVKVNEDCRVKAKQFLTLEDKDGLLIADNNQNAFLLDFWQEQDRDGCFLLLYTKPEIALTLALDGSVSSQIFIEEWKSSVRQLLSFQRRNRDRSILVDANAAIASPDEFIQIFNKKTNLSLKNLQNNIDFFEPKNLDVLFWLSREILANNEEIKDLESELEACGMPIGRQKETAYLSVSAIEKECIRINENIKQFDITGKELVDTKKSLDHQLKLNKELELLCQKNNINKDSFVGDKGLDTSQNKTKDVELENELLVLQLHQVQEELEYYYIEYQKLSGAYHTHENKVLSELEKNKLYKKATKKKVKELFNMSWYEKSVGKRRFSFQHYLTKGWKDKISPHPLFDPVFYIEENQLFELLECPLVHFVAFGNVLELNPHPLFDTKWYLSQYPDVKESGINPLVHYLKFGVFDGRNPSNNFNTYNYLNNYPDVQESELNPLVHYVLYGQEENRVPT